MQITCLGASRCVTGSNFLIDNGRKYLVDCGLFQGGGQMERLNHGPWGFNPSQIEALFLTHTHIDHSGRIPRLVKDGFRGKIYATGPTVELARILLLDSAHIQEMEARWQGIKNKRRGESAVEPLYRIEDAQACLPLFVAVKEDEVLPIDPDLTVAFHNAGHILGSSLLEITGKGPEGDKRIVFSGDLGYIGHMILRPPAILTRADVLFIESTYGNRNHKTIEASEQELLKAIRYSFEHGEKVLIPAFAVERTQELLFMIGKFFREKLIPPMPVYLDSPLAIAATAIFRQMGQYYDSKTRAAMEAGNDPFDFESLVSTRSTEESIEINKRPGPAIVIAGNGMCSAGRIRHHLKHNLWRPGCSLVIPGYQAAGTLGRSLVEGARMVKILGERVIVRAKIFTIGGLSAHADQNGLIEWLGHFKNPAMRVYVIHGESTISEEFAGLVRQKFGFEVHVPSLGDRITDSAAIEPGEKPAPIDSKAPAPGACIAEIAQKADALKNLLDAAELPVHVLRRIEDEMLSARAHLDEALQSAREKR
ncbi:MAG: MBL fold metallo-hydrolase [Syntrophobacteraceae bacterium]|nr:MBL fold metallo-hydrolase [Syntrophobacteraceae bacterium]